MTDTGYGPNSVIVKPQKPLVHSWSSLNAFAQCPWRFYLTKVAKTVTERQSPQMAEGNDRHRALEVSVRDGIPLPSKYEKDRQIVETLRMAPGKKIVEWQFGLNKNWQPTTFFAQDVWIRGKIDVGVIGAKTALILDYKTGKRKIDTEQLELFAIPTFASYPYLERVDSGYVWLESTEKKVDKESFTPDKLPDMREKFAMRIHQVDDAVKRGVWIKQPSGLCREYCPVGRAKCEFCGS